MTSVMPLNQFKLGLIHGAVTKTQKCLATCLSTYIITMHNQVTIHIYKMVVLNRIQGLLMPWK